MSDTEHDHEGHVHSRTRNIWHEILDDGEGDDDGTLIAVDHVYLPDGSFACGDCGAPGHDPGLVGLIVGEGSALLEPELALIVANRLTRVANLILESREEPPDIEREAHRLGAPVELPGSSFKAGDVISVPPEVVRVTGFRPNSRLVIKRRKASQRPGRCKACGAAIEAGDLYAAATEPTSDRCIRCVDGWPLAATGPKGIG